jgi:hypothetical protein
MSDVNNYPDENAIAYADGFIICINHEKPSIINNFFISNFFINDFILSTIIINYSHLLTDA